MLLTFYRLIDTSYDVSMILKKTLMNKFDMYVMYLCGQLPGSVNIMHKIDYLRCYFSKQNCQCGDA